MARPIRLALDINYNTMKYYLIILLFSVFIAKSGFSQLEKVFIEKYYISDTIDATDTSGGILIPGSTTYRIYVDMKPGFKLKKLFGDDNHEFSIKSTEVFYNHAVDGQTFPKDLMKARYGESLVALDTWITIGQTTKTQGGKTYFGIPKDYDFDGSFIGGANNDGGSEFISTGLLTNVDTNAGRPVTVADGMDTLASIPNTWFSVGITDFATGSDSTIFGSIVSSSVFRSTNFELRNSGVSGVDADSNHVLIAQLTTKGQLEYHLNLQIEGMVNGVLKTFTYVSSDSILLPGEYYHPFLIYPLECGCNDPTYLEYNPKAGCLEPGSCVTPIVYGCMDTMACNYDPLVNLNVEGLCCYPGFCNGRDLIDVCPQLLGDNFDVEVYPNPSSGIFTLDIYSGITSEPIRYTLYNAYGYVISDKTLTASEKITGEIMDLSDELDGLYHLKVQVGNKIKSQIIIKAN